MSLDKINATTNAIAEAIDKTEYTIDPQTGLATIDSAPFIATLPEGLTEEHATMLFDHITNFTNGGTKSAGGNSIKVMKDNKDLKETEVRLNMIGDNYITVNVKRQGEVNIPAREGQEARKEARFGLTRTGLHLVAGKNKGQMAHVRDWLTDFASEALSDE